MTYLKAPCDGCGTVIEWVEPDPDLPRHCGCRDQVDPETRKAIPTRSALDIVLAIAIERERRFNIRHFVMWSVPCRGYVVTDSMPFMGEWYSADGVQHGSAVPA